jgi:putative Mn2+ efflux pump MntP
MPWVVSMVLSFVAPIALFIYFTFSEFTMRIYAFIGFSIVTLLGAVFGYAVFRRNEQQKLLCEAEQMKDEIEHRLHQLEFFSEQT